jgi:hypothetical protein
VLDAPTGSNASRDRMRTAMGRAGVDDAVLGPWSQGNHDVARLAAIDRYSPWFALYKALERAYGG